MCKVRVAIVTLSSELSITIMRYTLCIDRACGHTCPITLSIDNLGKGPLTIEAFLFNKFLVTFFVSGGLQFWYMSERKRLVYGQDKIDFSFKFSEDSY